MADVVQRPQVMTFVVWKKYTLTLCLWKGKYPGTRRLECICRGRRRPDAIYLDTYRREEKATL